ncbi:ABC transporter permease subunit [Catenulispora pinisilvae]|uniref:ABC transporter permease subunit n=1 Tax=Catenulispora pinisilvae TaxID=2705253 RepID=UPI001891AB96|nr:ABC transporter permease subunit [Catenulispora pinisilvae]
MTTAPTGYRATLRSEWIKLRTVRSTYATLAVAVIIGVGVGLLDVSSIAGHWDTMNATDKAAFDPVGDSLSGFQFGELALGALGVLAVSTEYATGMIRTTLAATPRRGALYAAKVLTAGLFALAVSQVFVFGAFFIGQAVLSGKHLDVGLAEPNVLRAVSMAGFYLAVVTMVGFGLGAIIRHTAGAMAAMFALVFLTYPAARALEGFSYLPDHLVLPNAVDVLATTHAPTGPHAARVPSLGFAYFDLALYLVVFLGLGAWRATRDA